MFDAERGIGKVSIRAVDAGGRGNCVGIRFAESDCGTYATGCALSDDVGRPRNRLTCASVGAFVTNPFLGILSGFRVVSDETGNACLDLLFLLHMF